MSNQFSNKEKVAMRFANVLIVLTLLMLVLNVKSCADNMTVIEYDGFKHECEKLGGVVNDGKCWDPSALIDMDSNVKPVLHVNRDQ